MKNLKRQRPTTPFMALAALSVLFLSAVAPAQTDPATSEALEKTTALLRDPAQRDKAIAESPDAQKNHGDLKKFAGSEENVNGTYGISANILEKMVKDSNGDASEMQKMIEQAQRNPTSFYEGLTPEQKRNIDALAKQIESSTASSPH